MGTSELAEPSSMYLSVLVTSPVRDRSPSRTSSGFPLVESSKTRLNSVAQLRRDKGVEAGFVKTACFWRADEHACAVPFFFATKTADLPSTHSDGEIP